MIRFFYGIIIGIGFIMPGVSGGVIATILGIYDELIKRINHFFTNILDNIKYLIPIISGVILSIWIFSKIIIYFLNNYIFFISYIFMGLILGSIPFLNNEIKKRTNKHIKLIPFFIAFAIGIGLFLIEKNIPMTFNSSNIFVMLIGGCFYAIGKIVPGISGASLLMLLGIYEYLLTIIANPFSLNNEILLSIIPFIISFIISSIFILKLMEKALNNHFRVTYSSIIGFIVSSLLFIYPNYISFTSLITLTISFIISYYIGKKKK